MKMRYCTKCITPESAATVAFDSDGVCNICRQAEVKHREIDWDTRRKILDEIIEKYRGQGNMTASFLLAAARIRRSSCGMLWHN